MSLKKRLNKQLVAGAYIYDKANERGISLAIKKEGDSFLNAIASLEMREDKPVLLINQKALEHSGIEIKMYNEEPKKW